MRRRVMIAKALVHEPRILFLDEPCANLDGSSIREIEEILREAVQAGTQIIMTTHHLGQARRLADHVVFLNNGQIEEQASAAPFFDAPSSVGASAFLNGDILE